MQQKNMADYEFLKEYNPHRVSMARQIKDFISDAIDMVFGALSPFEDDDTTDTDSESEKLDIAQGEKSEYEDEKEDEKRQKGQRLKIMIPKQMITRLTILLAQLKAGNSSQKLKNEIRQIAYSLYGSKILSKHSITI